MIESKLKTNNCNRGQLFRDPTRSKQLSTVAIVGFQFGLYHVVAPLSFSRSISLALFVILSIACCFNWLAMHVLSYFHVIN